MFWFFGPQNVEGVIRIFTKMIDRLEDIICRNKVEQAQLRERGRVVHEELTKAEAIQKRLRDLVGMDNV